MSKDKKDILLITHYYHFPSEKDSSRYRTLAQLIAGDDRFDLEVVTSSFYHRTKQQRDRQACLAQQDFRVTLVDEPGYSKNISLARLHSAKVFGRNVLAYLKGRKRPDLIYQVVPSLDVADEVSRFAKENKIPLMVDIQDLWPEAFKMAIDIPVVSDIAFYPMLRKANRIYSRADSIVAVSDTYVERGLSVNRQCKKGLSVYIGTDMDLAREKMAPHTVSKPEGEFWVTYIGALGHSYDIELIIKALAALKEKGIDNLVFHVMGEGVRMERFEQTARELGVNAVFHGHTQYGLMMARLAASDVAVNPIVGKSAASIINKVADYAAAGVPVVNTQNSEEYRRLLERYRAGINCPAGDVESTAQAILQLYEDETLRNEMRMGQQRLAKDKFSRGDTYPKLLACMHELLNSKTGSEHP
ncbi:MAG: glycosyltransferase family 4 protein [Oscillospiraceae bacterium]|nr:glycosyltransferase family 4 protein [Oscillospiraceae bacterium]